MTAYEDLDPATRARANATYRAVRELMDATGLTMDDATQIVMSSLLDQYKYERAVIKAAHDVDPDRYHAGRPQPGPCDHCGPPNEPATVDG